MQNINAQTTFMDHLRILQLPASSWHHSTLGLLLPVEDLGEEARVHALSWHLGGLGVVLGFGLQASSSCSISAAARIVLELTSPRPQTPEVALHAEGMDRLRRNPKPWSVASNKTDNPDSARYSEASLKVMLTPTNRMLDLLLLHLQRGYQHMALLSPETPKPQKCLYSGVSSDRPQLKRNLGRQWRSCHRRRGTSAAPAWRVTQSTRSQQQGTHVTHTSSYFFVHRPMSLWVGLRGGSCASLKPLPGLGCGLISDLGLGFGVPGPL